MTLPAAFLSCPIAHRALHDVAQGRPENSLSAIRAAIGSGYGIEIDLQLSQDGQAMVFHDYDLSRLTGETGPLAQRSAAQLGQITLRGSSEAVPTLHQVLIAVAGKVPLLIELKDQHGAMGETDGRLEQATVAALAGYQGPVALMSFNPHMVARLAQLAPHLPRGLTTESFPQIDWPTVPEPRLAELRGIPDYDRVGACFISHDWHDLSSARVAALKDQGATILCWTIKTAEQEAQSRRIADNITFEGYAA